MSDYEPDSYIDLKRDERCTKHSRLVTECQECFPTEDDAQDEVKKLKSKLAEKEILIDLLRGEKSEQALDRVLDLAAENAELKRKLDKVRTWAKSFNENGPPISLRIVMLNVIDMIGDSE